MKSLANAALSALGPAAWLGMDLKADCQDETESLPYPCLCAGRSLAAHYLSGHTELLCLLDLCVQTDPGRAHLLSRRATQSSQGASQQTHLPATTHSCHLPCPTCSAGMATQQQKVVSSKRHSQAGSTHGQQEALTSRSPMVLSLQSSRWMLGVSVCSSAAMRRAPCRRALPNGSSSTPMVVRMADFCKQRRRHCQGPCKRLGVQRARDELGGQQGKALSVPSSRPRLLSSK